MAAPFPSATSTWHSTTYDAISPKRAELSAKGKTVLVTGGGTGIGAETARSFAEAGASHIAIIGRREQPLLDTKAAIEKAYNGVKVFTASVDVTRKDQVDKAFVDFVGAGKLDIVVSNAAWEGNKAGIDSVDPDEFMECIRSNVLGSLLVAQAFIRHAAEGAVGITISSFAAHMNMGNVFAAYGTAKAGVARLWNNVSMARPDIRVYHLHPGVVDTEMNRRAGGARAMGFSDDGKSIARPHLHLTGH